MILEIRNKETEEEKVILWLEYDNVGNIAVMMSNRAGGKRILSVYKPNWEAVHFSSIGFKHEVC